MKDGRKSISGKNIFIALVLLVCANVLMGLILMYQSRAAVRTQIEQRMLDISNTAAYMLDGEEVRDLTDEDKGSPEYEEAMGTLRSFQQNIDLEYIYAISIGENGTFTFNIDPAVDDPGPFGSPVVSTDALRKAARGFPAVDAEPYEDEWGRFYSAYSPVFDSQGKVAVVVAVDFSAEWMESQVTKQVTTIGVVTVISLILGVILAYNISARYRRRFTRLNAEMTELKEGFKELDRMVMSSSAEKLDLIPDSKQSALVKALASGEDFSEDADNDELTGVNRGLHDMQKSLQRYINYVDSQTYIDPMTGVGNRAAYHKAVVAMDDRIQSGEGGFAIGFFDINGLEQINARYGYAMGDELLLGAATIIRNVFGQKNTYRIVSDEFIVIMEDKLLIDMDEYMREIDRQIARFNEEREADVSLSLSRGVSVLAQGKDENYRQVFNRAEEAMSRSKRAFKASLNEESS